MIASGYDTMEVCIEGHQTTSMATSFPEGREPFCSKCGAKTITLCPECSATIRGFYHVPGFLSTSETPVPNNCHACGTAYPWRQTAIASAIEILEMQMEGQDVTGINALIHTVVVDSPRAEVAALKLKRMVGKLAKSTYDVAIKVISDIASHTAKKTLWLIP
jgi:hypothetical protein